MLRVEVQEDRLILTQIHEETGAVSIVPKYSIFTYENVHGIEKKGIFACIFWPQPDDKMGKAPLVVMRRSGDDAIVVRALPQILNVQVV